MGRAEAGREFALLRRWLLQAALPLWSTRGVDSLHGGFFERLTPQGGVIDDPRRARLVGRQIYAFATATRFGWSGASANLVRHGLEDLDRRFIGPDGILRSVAGSEDILRDGGFDLYDHAFVLFGWAAAHTSGHGNGGLVKRAASLRDDLRAGWAHPLAGFEEARPRRLPLKSNPHMHLLEASLAWLAIAPDRQWQDLADEIAELCLARFAAPPEGAVREYFDGDWRPVETEPDDIVEPGHQFEWAWLLIRWGQLRGRPDAIALARRLIGLAEERGVEAGRGLVVNALHPDLSPRDRLARLWPQTERIKAFVALASLGESETELSDAWTKAAIAAAGLRRFLRHPVEGAWWEHIGEDGLPLAEPARASSLYHIVCALEVMAEGLDCLVRSSP